MRVWRRGRNHHVLFAPGPQDGGRDEHQHTGNPECNRGSEMSQKQRHKKRSKERSEVDDPIESVEYDLGSMLVRLIELVADKCGHARFDAAGAERDQSEPDVEAGAVCDNHRQARLTQAINETQPEDRVVFAEKAVGQPAAQQREKVNANHERVKYVLRAACAVGLRQIKKQRRDEENGQNVPHPVKAEALASFVPDDVADLLRDRRMRIRRNARRSQRFRLSQIFYISSVTRMRATRNSNSVAAGQPYTSA